MSIYISIGAQCATPTLFDRLQVKKESLPFDWMFSTPEFVYSILHLLLIENKEIQDIIDNHFFICDKRAKLEGLEHHTFHENGSIMVNTKYNVSFPHDEPSGREKYIRRMERLKEIILDKGNFIKFVYVSVASPTKGNYTLNGVEPIQDIYGYIEKINSILKNIRTNYQILVFDTNRPFGIRPSDSLRIKYYDLQKKTAWHELLPELINKYGMLLKNHM
jgi:hypothetical protein